MILRPRAGRPVGAMLLVVALAGALVVLAGPAVAAVGFGVLLLASSAARLLRSEVRAQRVVVTLEQQAAGLRHVAEGLRVGMPPERAIGAAAGMVKGDVGEAMREFVRELRTNRAVAAPPGDAVVRRLRTDVRVSLESGASLAELVAALESELRERARLARRVHASLAGVRATGVLLCGLPPAALLFGHLLLGMPPQASGVAALCVGSGLVLQAGGVVWLAHIATRARSL